jgi:hypothetical protein
VAVAACGIDTTTPTYTALFRRYFAPGTPGHCATAGCHLDDSNGWACGTTKETCYQGMVGIDLINLQDPQRSAIGDPKNSPLRWINLNGPMPQDNPQPFPEGRDAIVDWVAAGAQDN